MSKRAPNPLKRGDHVKPDVKTLCNELVSVSDWRKLGLNLGVQDYELDKIERSHPSEDCGRWMQETFSLWLRHTPNASWGDVVGALRRMGENTVAERIEQKYIVASLHASPLTPPSSAKEFANAGTSSTTRRSSSFIKSPLISSTEAIEERNVQVIKSKFSNLVTKSCETLQSREIDVEEVETFLIIMYSSPNSRDGNNMVITVVGSARSLKEIFRALSIYGFWDYINYYLLQSIIEKFACDDDELNNMMEQYQKDLTGYALTLQIKTYLDATHCLHPISTTGDSDTPADMIIPPQQKHELFEELSVKIDANVTDHTLSYVIDLWQSLEKQFRLPQPVMILHNIAKGCISITWLIPANLVEYITKMAQETSSVFAEKHILRVMLKEQCIYPMETEPPQLVQETSSVFAKKHNLSAAVIRLECGDYVFEVLKPSALSKDAAVIRLVCGDQILFEKPEASLPETELPLLETEPPLLETKPPLLDTGLPLPETESPPPETEPPLLETEPLLLETKPPLLETKPPLLETEPPLLETKPPLLETKLPLLETEPPLLETKPPQLETKPLLLETGLPLPETKSPLLETKPPPLETKPPLLETKPPLLKTEPPQLKTEPFLPETKPPLLEAEPPLKVMIKKQHIYPMEAEPLLPKPEKAALKKMNESSDSEEGGADHSSRYATPQNEDIPPIVPAYKHGYECKIIDPPAWVDALQTTCPICLQVLRNPHQTYCGHIFCKVCIGQFQALQKQTCPECKRTNVSTFPHESLRRMLNDLQVQCTIHNEEEACDWTGELRELDNHLNLSPTAPDQLLTGCKFVTLQCEFSYAGCKAQIPRKDMAIHMKVAQSYHNQLLAEKVKKQAREIEELTVKLRMKEEEIACTIQQMQEEFTLKLQSKDEAIAQLMQQKQDIKSTPHVHPVNFCFTVDKFKYQMENEVEWVSKPFYTHPQGYKMCVEVFINGLDSNKYVSLYTCIMKGENDNQLSWPFYGKLTVQLLNQKSDDHHHVYTIHYDKSIPQHYCERVLIGERNRGWGNHRFISHSKISRDDSIVQYVKDDCIKFRISYVLLYS